MKSTLYSHVAIYVQELPMAGYAAGVLTLALAV